MRFSNNKFLEYKKIHPEWTWAYFHAVFGKAYIGIYFYLDHLCGLCGQKVDFDELEWNLQQLNSTIKFIYIIKDCYHPLKGGFI